MSINIEVQTPAPITEKITVHTEEISLEDHIQRYETEVAELTPGTAEYTAKQDIVDYLRTQQFDELVENYGPKTTAHILGSQALHQSV